MLSPADYEINPLLLFLERKIGKLELRIGQGMILDNQCQVCLYVLTPMPNREHEPNQLPETEATSPLPPALADFLRDREYACVTQATDKGTAFVVKAPAYDIQSIRGRVPISLSHELYAHPSAPVVRIVLTIYDQPDRPLALEPFINVEDSQQARDFAALAKQEEAYLLFYDEQLRHRLTKGIPLRGAEIIADILTEANSLLPSIPKEQFDFDKAKAAVMAAELWLNLNNKKGKG